MVTEPVGRVDAKGLACPLPVVRAGQAMEQLGPGDILEVVATDPGSVADFESWTKMSGHRLLESREDGGVYTYLIRKGGDGDPEEMDGLPFTEHEDLLPTDE